MTSIFARYLIGLLRKGYLNAYSYKAILEKIPKIGEAATKKLVHRGVRAHRRALKYDTASLKPHYGSPLTYPSKNILKRLSNRPTFYGKAARESSNTVAYNNPRIPEILQKWKKKSLPKYIDLQYGEIQPARTIFYEPKLGAQLSVNTKKHLAKQSSGGYGGQTMTVPVNGKMTKIRGPWSSRAGIVRRDVDSKFRSWDEISIAERVKRLREYEKDMSLLELAMKSTTGTA